MKSVWNRLALAAWFASAAVVVLLCAGCGGGYDATGFPTSSVIAAAAPPSTAAAPINGNARASAPVATPVAEPRWIDAWGAMLVANDEYDVVSKTVGASYDASGKTVRQKIRLSASGDKFRLRLSNRFGVKPITLDNIRLAVSPGLEKAANDVTAIETATDRGLTFNGNTQVVIQVGENVESDVIDFRASRFDKLAVSFYVVDGQLPNRSSDIFPADTTFIVTGNAPTVASLISYPEILAFNATYLLEGLQVVAPTGMQSIVVFGDSITYGAGSTDKSKTSWPARFETLINAPASNRQATVINAAISGNELTTEQTGNKKPYQPKGLDRFEQDVLSRPGLTDIVVLIGTNDIQRGTYHLDEALSVQEIVNGYKDLIALTHKKDPKIRVYLGTITPFFTTSTSNTASYWVPFERTRINLNRWIMGDAVANGFEGVIDFSSALASSESRSTGPNGEIAMARICDSGDQLHPGDFGYDVMATLVYDVLVKQDLQPARPCNPTKLTHLPPSSL